MFPVVFVVKVLMMPMHMNVVMMKSPRYMQP
jgi:hypothetical protein